MNRFVKNPDRLEDHGSIPSFFALMKTLILLFAILICLSAQGQEIEPTREWQHFDHIANYLTRGSGKWRGENSQRPNNQDAPRAFGLWFERPLPALMTLTIVAYLPDTVIISSQGTFNWHPQKNHVLHVVSDRGNGYAEGTTSFPNDSTFISVMKIFRPGGQAYDHMDENFLVSEDVHRNVSFGKDSLGNWEVRSEWVWRREGGD